MFSDQEISQIAVEIDAQLLELRSLSGNSSLKSGDKESQLVKQNFDGHGAFDPDQLPCH